MYRFGFEGWISVLIASIPDLCIHFSLNLYIYILICMLDTYKILKGLLKAVRGVNVTKYALSKFALWTECYIQNTKWLYSCNTDLSAPICQSNIHCLSDGQSVMRI